MDKDVLCPICLTSGKVSITKGKDDAFFECPVCKCGVWPPEDDPDMVKRMRQQKAINHEYRSCSLPEGVNPHGGSNSKATGKSGKDRMKKKTTSKINFGLDSPRYY